MPDLENFLGALRRPAGPQKRVPAQANAYVAPEADEHYLQLSYSSPAPAGETSRRRYTGRSARRTGPAARPPVDPTRANREPIVLPVRSNPSIATPARKERAGAASPAWSGRLIAAVGLIAVLLVAWRVTGLLTPAVDPPAGTEATYAAAVSVLTGRTAGALEPVRLMPPPSPWLGEAPANPEAGLPVYTWLAAGATPLLGGGAAAGRAVSLLLSLLAGMSLFAVVRRAAGARSALYAMLLYSVAPLGAVLGQQYSPASLLLAVQAGVVLAIARWRGTVTPAIPQGTRGSFGLAAAAAIAAGLLDPGALFLCVPAAYLVIAPQTAPSSESKRANPIQRVPRSQTVRSWTDAWAASANRGRFIALSMCLVGGSAAWWVFTQGSLSGTYLGAQDGGGGVGAAVAALLNAATYSQIIGLTVERVLTVAGLLLLGAGLLHAARPPMRLLFHAWLAGGLLHVLLDAARLGRHDDVLLPILLPLCALAGIGAAWAGALPARLWLAVNEQKRDPDGDFVVSPHTSWLLDLPEERNVAGPAPRPQAQLALGRSVAERSQTQLLRMRRATWLAAGHLLVLLAIGFIVGSGAQSVMARLKPTSDATLLSAVGGEIESITPPGTRIVIAGTHAPELFAASSRTGWAVPAAEFSLAGLQALHREGASYLLSADQEWLGHHSDYRGLITTYSVARLSPNYILFDLNTPPSANDRLYFLESGHTLGGSFRVYWEQNGGVAKLGYPISEELQEVNPLDGQTRTTQYFERAILELHKEKAGTRDEVMLASAGLWVTQGRDFPRATPFSSTPDRWYFAETGHSVREAFLRYWQRNGGLAAYGYPISEELPEISAADGKVYTVQYFERARFEWHPTFAGTPDEVQLGLIGKQALEMKGR